jgi:hypothetical protein
MSEQTTAPTERDELAEIIRDAQWADGNKFYRSDGQIAEAILAAGYRKPRTVTTVEELDALPNGTIVSLPSGFPCHRRPDDNWYIGSHRYPLTTEEFWDNIPAPERHLTVLREGGQP